MKVVVIGSGSKGNSTYIETKSAKILIDAGISKLQVTNRLLSQGINLTKLDAIFVTHEHTDHIRNLELLLVKTGATLYIKEETFIQSKLKLKTSFNHINVEFIEPDYKYTINDLDIIPIKLSHDTSCCLGYLVREITDDDNDNITFATITDTGMFPKKYYDILSCVNTILLESNHDVNMLKNSGRPYELIERILSNQGHLSNKQCADILKSIVTKNTKRVILGHISEECNEYDKAYDNIVKTFDNDLSFKLYVAYQYKELCINSIGDNDD